MDSKPRDGVSLVSQQGLSVGCSSDSCKRNQCSPPFTCVDLWRVHECRYAQTRARLNEADLTDIKLTAAAQVWCWRFWIKHWRVKLPPLSFTQQKVNSAFFTNQNIWSKNIKYCICIVSVFKTNKVVSSFRCRTVSALLHQMEPQVVIQQMCCFCYIFNFVETELKPHMTFIQLTVGFMSHNASEGSKSEWRDLDVCVLLKRIRVKNISHLGPCVAFTWNHIHIDYLKSSMDRSWWILTTSRIYFWRSDVYENME